MESNYKKNIEKKEVFWINPSYEKFDEAIKKIHLSHEDVKDAAKRLERFAPYLKAVFPELESSNGMIESSFVKIPKMKTYLEQMYQEKLEGQLFLKCDSHLPISRSVKARGGIYEVLKLAEDLALSNKLMTVDDNYEVLNSDRFKNFYSQYTIAVGSTGNLGLSIGIMSAALGFNVTVHMSNDAKEWKKELLKKKGVQVVEYKSDYSTVVEEGRTQAESDSKYYFIDDENSTTLFLGYAVAAYRLKEQLDS